MMETLVIHEMHKEFLDLPLENYTLTFDDALYSQYYYWPLIKELNTRKILFVSPCLINKDPSRRDQFAGEYRSFPSCFEAMKLYKEYNDRTNYMTVNEIKHMMDEGCSVGCHSFSHFRDLNMRLYNLTQFIKNDTETMLEWFDKNLGTMPKAYAFPHFIEHRLQRVILKSYGFNEFFGVERMMIEVFREQKKEGDNK